MVIHKADYKRKIEKYIGFGMKSMHPTALCAGPKGVYAGKSYEITRNWKNVTCKHCLKRKPVDRRHGITYMNI